MREPRQYEAPLCAQVDGDIWFPDKGASTNDTRRAKAICKDCIHQIECAEWGIYNEQYGIWGGISQVQREVIRRKRNIRLPRERRSA